MQIEHNPNEKRPPKWFWKAAFAVIAIFWLLHWGEEMNWPQIMLGLGTGIILMGWVMEITGGEIPKSWRSKTPRR